jgi:TetR/AcrR family transcriptional regulator, tetracycline repressor protein
MPRNPRYDLEELVNAGLELVHQSGFEAVTLRSIAAAVGISAMALYRVIPNSDALKALIADAAARALQPPDGSLETILDTWANEAYMTLTEYPGLATFVLNHWTDLPRWLEIVDTLLGLASNEGVEGPTAVARVNAVFAYVLGRAQLKESVAGSARSLSLLKTFPDRFEHIRANRKEFLVAESDRHFAFGLTALIAGLRVLDETATSSAIQ